MTKWQRCGGAMILLSALSLSGCSGSQEDEEKLEPTEEAQPEDGGEAEAAAEPEAPADDAAAIDQLAETTPAPEPAVAAAAPMGSGVEAARVVRFVNQDEASIHGGPQDTTELVGKLLKGDRVLIVEENGWGRIADGMFIKLDALSNKAVPRNRQPAVWQTPAH